MRTKTHRITWTLVTLAVTLTCSAPFFAEGGVDAGRARWTKQAPIPTWYSLQGIAPISPTECWIASSPLLDDVGELAHTTDAGRTWTVVMVDRQVNAIAFVDSYRQKPQQKPFLTNRIPVPRLATIAVRH